MSSAKTLNKRQDRLAAAFALRHLANMLDSMTLNDSAQIVKFNENHDEQGRFASGSGGRKNFTEYGLDAGGESLPLGVSAIRPSHAGLLHRAAVYIKSPEGRKMLGRAVGLTAATVAAHFGDEYAAELASSFIGEHLGVATSAASLAAMTVGIGEVSRKLGLTVEGAKNFLAHSARVASRMVTQVSHSTSSSLAPGL